MAGARLVMFWVGLTLTVTALVIWVVMGRRPTIRRVLDDGRQVVGPPSMHRPPPLPDDAVDVRCVAAEPAPAPRLATVQPGQDLVVSRDGAHWTIADDEGRLAHVGLPAERPDQPAPLATPRTSHLPDHGTLWVDRVLRDTEGRTVDLRGPVHPDPHPELPGDGD